MIDLYGHLGAPPVKQVCPKSVAAGDLDQPAPLPGISPGDDPEKVEEIQPAEKTTWFKVGAIGLTVYAGMKVLGWL